MPRRDKDKTKAYQRKYYAEHRLEKAKRNKAYRSHNSESIKVVHGGWYQRNKQSISVCRKRRYAGNINGFADKCRVIIVLRKLEVLNHYSDGTMRCLICGEERTDCLSVDHIEGGGNAHRRQLRVSDDGFYKWLIRNHYPEGYRILCMNCQFIKRAENQR